MTEINQLKEKFFYKSCLVFNKIFFFVFYVRNQFNFRAHSSAYWACTIVHL